MINYIRSRLLDIPIIYNLQQTIFAPGAEKNIIKEINGIVKKLPSAEKYLDVGCGPKSLLWQIGIKPIGLDISKRYIIEYNKFSKSSGVVGSADSIPFDNNYFDSIWSIGLFHHLTDSTVQLSLIEMLRVCRANGHIIIFDAVLPKSPLKKPIPWLIRKLDRGRYMRKETPLLSLIPDNFKIIHKQRITYSYNGLEALVLIIRKEY